MRDDPWCSVVSDEDVARFVEYEKRKLERLHIRLFLMAMEAQSPERLTIPVLKKYDYGRCDG